MANKYAKRRAKVLKLYMGSEWAWHWKSNGTLWVRNIIIQEWIKIGKIEPINKKPIAMPEISPP